MTDDEIKESSLYKKLEAKIKALKNDLSEADHSIYILENTVTKNKNDTDEIIKSLQVKNEKLNDLVVDLEDDNFKKAQEIEKIKNDKPKNIKAPNNEAELKKKIKEQDEELKKLYVDLSEYVEMNSTLRIRNKELDTYNIELSRLLTSFKKEDDIVVEYNYLSLNETPKSARYCASKRRCFIL